MSLKPYSELVKLDVTPFCERRKSKDDNGRPIEILYLNWAKCKELLHENGAETVYFTPMRDSNGSFVFCSKEVENKDGRRCGCYFVSVEIHIDEKVFTMDMPLMNGNIVVYEDTLNQLRISNSHARAFVKGVAIHTGLGFNLWVKDGEAPEAGGDDLYAHSVWAIKKRIEQLITVKLDNGLETRDICRHLGISEKQFNSIMGYFNTINNLEKMLKEL